VIRIVKEGNQKLTFGEKMDTRIWQDLKSPCHMHGGRDCRTPRERNEEESRIRRVKMGME